MNNDNFCAGCEIIISNSTASMKPAQYETKHNAKKRPSGLQLVQSCDSLSELVVETRQQHVSLPKKTASNAEESHSESKCNQPSAFAPALPGSMMRLRRGWNKWRLRGRALTSERLRYFGPAPYSGDGAGLWWRTERSQHWTQYWSGGAFTYHPFSFYIQLSLGHIQSVINTLENAKTNQCLCAGLHKVSLFPEVSMLYHK